MPKATLMVRFKRPSDQDWVRRPAVYGSTGRVRSGFVEFKDRKTSRRWVEGIGEDYSFEIRVEDGGTTYKPAGRNGVDAEAKRLAIAGKLAARAQSEAAASSSPTRLRWRRSGYGLRMRSTITSRMP